MIGRFLSVYAMGLFTILWQLFNVGILVLVVFLIVSLFRSNSNRARQLERMEDKIDHLIERIDELKNNK